jgi:hypothetical protein
LAKAKSLSVQAGKELILWLVKFFTWNLHINIALEKPALEFNHPASLLKIFILTKLK